MATYYWVGGAGTWDGTDTTHWATSSGGAGGAGVPTSADDVVFDSASNATAYSVTVGGFVGAGSITGTTATVTSITQGTIAVGQSFNYNNSTPTSAYSVSALGSGSGGIGTYTIAGGINGSGLAVTLYTNVPVCKNITVAGPTSGNVTFSGAGWIYIYGSLSFPSTGLTWSHTGPIWFASTTTGNTITTNGVTLGSGFVTFYGSGGSWTLGSAYTSTSSVYFQQGTFSTGNFNLSITAFTSNATASTRSISFGSSTITMNGASALTFDASGLTFNAGTSTINCSASSPTFTGAGQTFYNVNFTATTIGTAIIDSNTFNNLNISSVTGISYKAILLSGNITVNGTLTLGTSASATTRMWVYSNTRGTQRTITANAIASLYAIDFNDIVAAGTSISGGNWSGTSIGIGGNNSNITGSTAKTVYYSLAAGGNWTSTAWATSSGGTPAVINYPLAQDIAIIDNNSVTSGNIITMDSNWWVGTIDFTSRTTAMTFATGVTLPQIYGDFKLSSSITFTGTGTLNFNGYNKTQTITSAALSYGQIISINAPLSTITLSDNLTSTNTTGTSLTQGTLNLNNNTLSTGLFSSNNTNVRALKMGTGTITLTGTGSIWNATTSTNFTVTPESSNIIVSDTSATAKTFAGGGLTYNNLTIAGGAGGAPITFTGSNKFNTFSATNTTGFTITFTAGTTTTVNNWNITGTSGNIVTLGSSTTSAYTIAKTGTNVFSGRYLNISYMTASPTTFSAFNSTNGGNNTGVTFDAAGTYGRISSTGTLYVPPLSTVFDEVTQSSISTTKPAFYASQFDEVTNPGVPIRYLNTGIVQTQGIIDEITGIN